MDIYLFNEKYIWMLTKAEIHLSSKYLFCFQELNISLILTVKLSTLQAKSMDENV